MIPSARLTDIWGGSLLPVDPVDHDPASVLVVVDSEVLLLPLLEAVLAADVLDTEEVLDCWIEDVEVLEAV